MIPCAANKSLTVTRDNAGTINGSKCFLCDGIPQIEATTIDPKRCQTVCSDAVLTFTKLIKLSAFTESRKPRVLAMLALKKYTAHFKHAEFMDLSGSPLGQWCVASLKSSSRELRIASG
jgi:serine/threonine-protein kinase ATR